MEGQSKDVSRRDAAAISMKQIVDYVVDEVYGSDVASGSTLKPVVKDKDDDDEVSKIDVSNTIVERVVGDLENTASKNNTSNGVVKQVVEENDETKTFVNDDSSDQIVRRDGEI